MKITLHPILRKILKILFGIVGGVIFLLILLVLLVRLPFVQDYITTKALSYYSEKIDTPASLGGIFLDFPYNISVRELYIEDQAGDTLLYVDRVHVNTDMFALIGRKLRLDKVSVRGLNGNVHNSQDDETFNYQFIVDGFASGEPAQEPDTTTGGSFTFEIGEVEITESRGNYYDYYHGILADADIGKLIAEAETFDLDSPYINVSYLSLQNTRSSVEILEANPYTEDTTSAEEPFNLGGEYAEILNTNLKLYVESAGLRMDTRVGQMRVEVDTLDINKQIYLGKNVVLAESSVAMDFYATESAEPEPPDDGEDEEPFHLIAGTEAVEFRNNDFRMTDHTASPVEGFDPAHINLKKIGFEGSDLRMDDLFMEGNISGLHVAAEGGPELLEGGLQFKYGPEEAYIRDLTLKTEASSFKITAEAHYPDTSALMAMNEEVRTSLNIDEGRLSLGDVYYFVPSLEKTLNEPPSTRLFAAGKASGTLGNLKLEGWRAQIDGGELRMPEARIIDVADLQAARFNIPDLQVNIEDQLIRRLLADSVYAQYNFPTVLRTNTAVEGYMNDLNLETRITSEIGNAEVWADFQIPADSVPVYAVSLSIDSLDVGHILADTTMGKVVMQAKVDGRGIEEDELTGELYIDVPYARFNSYEFQGLCGNGQLDGYSYNGNLSYRDEFLQIVYDGLVSLPSSGGRQDFELTMELIDFKGLGLTDRDLALGGRLNADVITPDTGNPMGQISLGELYLMKDLRIFNLDSIGLSSTQGDSLHEVHFDSKFLDLLWRTNFPITETWQVVRQHVDHYFNSDTTDILVNGDEYFDITLTVSDPVILTEAILPDLNYIRMEPMKARFDAASSDMSVELKIDSLAYTSIALDSLGFEVSSNASRFDSNLKVRELAQGPAVIHHTWLQAHSEPGEMELMLKFRDPDREDKYRMATTVKRDGDALRIRAHPDSLMLNYHQWKIPENNFIQWDPSGVWFENFRMTWRDKLLAVESKTESSDTITSILAQNIQLGELTRFNRDSTSIVMGLLDGKIDFVKGEGLPGITADLMVDDLTVLGETLGDFEAKSGIREGTVYNVDLSLVGNENNLSITGDYNTASKDEISLNAEIKPLSLKAMQVFVSNQLSDVEGKLLGSINIQGSLARPRVNGYLSFEDAGFRVNYLQNKLYVNDQRLEVSENTFQFNKFRLTDERDHEAFIDGKVSTRDFFFYKFNLTAKTNNFTLVDSEKGDNDLFYGLLRATSDVTIKGDSYLPRVNLNLELTDDSYFTYVIPEETIQEQMQNDVVRFVDQDREESFLLMDVGAIVEQVRDTSENVMTGIDLTASIKVKPENKLQIVIDPITGDQLTVQGEALLNLGIRPTGDINLTGRYQVNDGSYSMNFYGLVQREFTIREGSSIQWTGDPYSANMDVVAEYNSRASPPLQSYKSKLSFVVSLFLKGQILEPEISFDLNLAEDEPAPMEVQSWLAQLNQDDAELNKQVFGLLILNGFFDSGGTNSYDHMAQNTLRSSVSSLLSGELSKLTDQIEGVELSMAIDSYEDYNKKGQSIGRTQLELGVSKNLFDDRVIVKVAGNFDLEGSNSYRNNVSDFAGDIRVEYKLTEDGRFRLVGFRETNFDDLLQGQIIKTGGGFIYVKNYNAFKELFKKDVTGTSTNE